MTLLQVNSELLKNIAQEILDNPESFDVHEWGYHPAHIEGEPDKFKLVRYPGPMCVAGFALRHGLETGVLTEIQDQDRTFSDLASSVLFNEKVTWLFLLGMWPKAYWEKFRDTLPEFTSDEELPEHYDQRAEIVADLLYHLAMMPSDFSKDFATCAHQGVDIYEIPYRNRKEIV